MSGKYRVVLEVESHDPSDEFNDTEPTRYSYVIEAKGEVEADYDAREKAVTDFRALHGDVGVMVSVISVREVA